MTTTSDPTAAVSLPSTTSSFREQGNDEYRKGNYLKAAANYTKAIKEEPHSAALYSNRSAALTQLSKLPKALADAEECIRLEPEWDKGYFRKGAVLEAQGKLKEALEAYQVAAEKGKGTNRQAQEKVRNMQKLVRQRTAKGAEELQRQDGNKAGS